VGAIPRSEKKSSAGFEASSPATAAGLGLEESSLESLEGLEEWRGAVTAAGPAGEASLKAETAGFAGAEASDKPLGLAAPPKADEEEEEEVEMRVPSI